MKLSRGEDGLSDSRGRPSSQIPKKILSAEEQQVLEIESLKAKIKRLELHNELLKKRWNTKIKWRKIFKTSSRT